MGLSYFCTIAVIVVGTISSGAPTCLHPDCAQFRQLRLRKQMERNQEFAQYALQYPITRDTYAIMSLSFDDLLENLRTRRLSARDALRAHIAKSLNVTREFNCITNFIPQAMAWAAELDSSPIIRPLHGLPFCVKDDTDVVGLDTTVGLSRFLYKPATENAIFVQNLVDLGAVPFCKTNLPQGHLGAPGSDNPVFGTTYNSLNKLLSPGGSSSGTACLVAGGAVKFSTTTDIAGSGRIPAHFHGIAGISTTVGRLSAKGVYAYLDAPILKLQPGFIADKASTIATLYEAVANNELEKQYDNTVTGVRWRSEYFDPNRRLRIGYFTTMFAFPPLGDTEETVLRAADSLRQRGHHVESFQDFLNQDELYRIALDFVRASNGEPLNSVVRGDHIAPSLRIFIAASRTPDWILRYLLRSSIVSKRLKDTIRAGRNIKDPAALEKQIQDLSGMRQRLLDEMDRRSLDLILCPVFPTPAPLNSLATVFFSGIAYDIIWNLLNFPAGTVQFGFESGKNISSYNTDRDPVLWLAKTTLPASIGMPIGVQIAARTFEDEMVLRGMIELEKSKKYTY